MEVLTATGATSTAKWSATQLDVTVPDLTGVSPALAAADLARCAVMVNGVVSNSLTLTLA